MKGCLFFKAGRATKVLSPAVLAAQVEQGNPSFLFTTGPLGDQMPMPSLRHILLMGLLGFAALLPAQSPAAKNVPASDIRPCDIYNRAHTPCVAAFSTTRVLFATF